MMQLKIRCNYNEIGIFYESDYLIFIICMEKLPRFTIFLTIGVDVVISALFMYTDYVVSLRIFHGDDRSLANPLNEG